jgi:unsaturated rhamnogalacturonyl hydrolase
MNGLKWTWLFLLMLTLVLSLGILSCSCGDDDDDDSDNSGNDDDDDADDTTQDHLALNYARELAATWVRAFEPSQNAWSWDAGVLMMGMMAENTNGSLGQEFQDYAKDWIDHYLDTGFHIVSSDTSIPGLACLQLYKQSGEQKYLDAADKVWTYISEVAGRTSDGGLNHMGWMSGNQIWADTLFMIIPFLLEYAEVTGTSAPYEEIALQMEVFRRHLRDNDVGLYRHRYDDDTGEVLPAEPLYWGRGNGWVFVALVLANNRLPASIKAGMDFDLEADLLQTLESIRSMETVDGRYHTILNRTDTYLETSAALLYAYGVSMDALGQGIFSDNIDWIDLWMQGAIDQIVVDDAGDTLLLGTSCGTDPGGIEHYNQVLKTENVSYGLGLFLLNAVARMDIEGLSVLQESTGDSEENFLQPPVPCEGTDCGQFFMGRGNYNAAKDELTAALTTDPDDVRAHFLNALIEVIRLATGLLDQIDTWYIGEANLTDIEAWLIGEGRARALAINEDLSAVQAQTKFSVVLERLLLIEYGGHTAFGQREMDLGEAYLFDALAHLVVGITNFFDSVPAFPREMPASVHELQQNLLKFAWPSLSAGQTKGAVEGLEEIVVAIDTLIEGIDSIMAETDDQHDDLIPQNLLKLEGTFGIPGILPETDVMELLTSSGIPQEFLEELVMPADLIDLLNTVRGVLEWVIDLLS